VGPQGGGTPEGSPPPRLRVVHSTPLPLLVEKLKLSENAEAGFKADVQKLTDKYTKKLEEMIQAKEKDLTTM